MAKRWYVLHVYSGFEKKISQQIKEQAELKGLADHIGEIVVPTEEVTEVRRAQKVNTERKFFPGYVLIHMDMTDDAWHLVKDVPKVTGFLGSRNKPSPITRLRGRAHHEAAAGRHGNAPPRRDLRDRRAGSRVGRPVHQLQRRDRRGGRGEGPREGHASPFSAAPRRWTWNTPRSRSSDALVISAASPTFRLTKGRGTKWLT